MGSTKICCRFSLSGACFNQKSNQTLRTAFGLLILDPPGPTGECERAPVPLNGRKPAGKSLLDSESLTFRRGVRGRRMTLLKSQEVRLPSPATPRREEAEYIEI